MLYRTLELTVAPALRAVYRPLITGLEHVPHVMRVHAACMAHPAFASTQPSACPDAE